MEFTPFRIVVFAIAVLCLIYLFIFLKNLPQEDALKVLEKQIDLAQTDLGKENFVENVQFKSGQSFSGETFDLQTRSVSFNCNNIERCCEKGTKCNKTIEWTERNVSINDSKPIKTSARCDMQYGLFACRIYFGTKPAQLEITTAEIQKQIDLKQSNSAQLAVELSNSGELPAFLAKINAKLYQLEFKKETEEKKFVEEKSFEIESVLPNKKIQQIVEFSVPSDGNYLIELKAYADESGFDEKKVYFNAIDSTASACSVDGKDDEVSWNSVSKNCKQKYFCKNCEYAFECKDLWQKEINDKSIELKEWDSNYSYIELPCDSPDTPAIDPKEIGLQTEEIESIKLGNKTIVLDPGHGPAGKNTGERCSGTGAAYGGLREEILTLEIAKRVMALLQAKGVKVLLTRNESSLKTPDCIERANVANNSNADLLVDIHLNSSALTSGTESYYYSGNKASENKKLAQFLENEVTKSTGLKNRGVMPDTKTGKGSVQVLRNSKMPAALIESAYIGGDNAKLQKPEFRQKIAQGIYNGIATYYGGNFSSGGTGGGTTVSGNACQQKVVETAMKQLGKPYYWGAEGPNSFDCSGFVYYIYTAAGFGSKYGIRGTANTNADNKGIVVDGNPGVGKKAVPNFSKLQPGDIIFFNAAEKVGHTGIYIGNNQFIQSSGGKKCPGYPTGSTCQVKISKLGSGGSLIYNGARRIC